MDDMVEMDDVHGVGSALMVENSDGIDLKSVIISTFHCGAGCTVADIIGSILLYDIPLKIAGSTLFGGWGVNYILALIIGVYFEYAAIKPMSSLTTMQAIKKAAKADVISLTTWKLGMYGYVYLMMYKFHYIEPTTPLNWDYWFLMQQAMVVGFLISLPVNYLLIRFGIKKDMH